jgi:hypothetical protein
MLAPLCAAPKHKLQTLAFLSVPTARVASPTVSTSVATLSAELESHQSDLQSWRSGAMKGRTGFWILAFGLLTVALLPNLLRRI